MYLKQVKDVLTLYGGLIILKVIMETKYQNLINYIQEQISDGQLGPGEKVPSENQLSEQFHISRQTVRKAIGTLEEDGLVQRIRGSGTYVSFDRRKNLEHRNSIAVVTTYVDSYIFPRILQGMQNTLFESGFSVQIYFHKQHAGPGEKYSEGSVETGRCGRSDHGGDKERIAESEPGSVPAPDGQKDTASVFQYLLSRVGGTACIVK